MHPTKQPLNWKLILALSAVGLAGAAVTVWGGLGKGEVWLSLAVTLALAMVIAARAPSRYFLHGFLVGAIGTVVEILAQLPFFSRVLDHNPDMRQMFADMPVGIPPEAVMLLAAPVAAAFNGLLTGFVAWLVAKFLGKSQPAAGVPPASPPASPPDPPPPPPYTP